MKWFIQALKKFATFNGRSRRKEYWYFILFYYIFVIVLAVLDGISGLVYMNTIFSLIMLVPSIAVAVRRMHDVNKSGWFILVPVYNLVLCCTDGTAGENRYGRDPKRPEFDEFLEDKPQVQ